MPVFFSSTLDFARTVSEVGWIGLVHSGPLRGSWCLTGDTMGISWNIHGIPWDVMGFDGIFIGFDGMFHGIKWNIHGNIMGYEI